MYDDVDKGVPRTQTQEHYRLGVFTSSTYRTVQTAVAMLERAAGPGTTLFAHPNLILYRDHTMQVPPHHVHAGGKSWDTVKPLHPYFSKLHRVVLIDDDAFKVRACVCVCLIYPSISLFIYP